MKYLVFICTILAGNTLLPAYAANPASKEYVDTQIQSLQTQISNLPPAVAYTGGTGISVAGSVISNTQPGITYTAGSGIDITGNVITATATTPTYTLYQLAQGGVIYYLERGNAHGLAAALVNQSSGAQYEPSNASTGAELIGVYLGKQNTARLIQQFGAGTYAAALCSSYTDAGGHTDWYLPSIDELSLMYIESFNSTDLPQDAATYWSSTEYNNNANQGWYVDFSSGNQSHATGSGSRSVRCVRAF